MIMSYHDARTRALVRELDANPEILVLGGSLSLPFDLTGLDTYAFFIALSAVVSAAR